MDRKEYVRAVLQPLSVFPTGLSPKLRKLNGIEAVVFDVYGTLLISEAGGPDLSAGTAAERVMKEISGKAFRCGEHSMLSAYRNMIRRHQEHRRSEGTEHPEIDIRQVWRELLDDIGTREFDPEEMAIRFECGTNPVWPMPGSAESIRELAAAGFKLGIVSNAQFYTPLILEALFDDSLEKLGIEKRWRVFSYEILAGKPSLALFEELRARAESDGYAADKILYVGNDFDKDIVPASSVGFRTCLFAGDRRSLRVGKRDFERAAEFADVVITELGQILPLLDAKT